MRTATVRSSAGYRYHNVIAAGRSITPRDDFVDRFDPMCPSGQGPGANFDEIQVKPAVGSAE